MCQDAEMAMRRKIRMTRLMAASFANPSSFLASNIHPHPKLLAYLNESQRIGSTSIAAARLEYRLSVQKQGKPVLAIRSPLHWGPSAAHPHAFGIPYANSPLCAAFCADSTIEKRINAPLHLKDSFLHFKNILG